MSETRYAQNPETAWATQASMQQFKIPTMEPHYTKKDDNLMKYLFERCIVYTWDKDENGNRIRVADSIAYQDILDAVYLRLSHLESISYLSHAHAEVTYCKWRLDYWIMWSNYDARGDQEALHLLRELDLTVHNIIFGRALEGTHQLYDAAVAGSRRTMTIEDGGNKGGGGFFGRFRR